MSRTLAQEHATNLVKALVEHAKGLGNLEHQLTKGELKELDVSDVLQQFLTIQFGIGSGIIINRDDKQSRQTDVVIYDRRIIPPVVERQGRGIYPVESVVATVSIRTMLDGTGVLEAEEAARFLLEEVVAGYAQEFPPLNAVLGFSGGIAGLGDQVTGEIWVREHIRHLFDICIAGRYSWANVGGKGWTIGTGSPSLYNETKRFLALLLDNIRTRGEARYRYFLAQGHQDWFSRYIRD